MLIQSKNQVNDIVKLVLTDKNELHNLVNLSLGNNHPISWRATWALSHTVNKDQSIILPFVQQFIDRLNSPINNSHAASVLKILSLVDITNNYDNLGLLVDNCINYISNPEVRDYVKKISIDVLLKICILEPDLLHEVECVVSEALPHFKAKAIKQSCIKQLKNKPK